jgi:membrane glycosyltransferase
VIDVVVEEPRGLPGNRSGNDRKTLRNRRIVVGALNLLTMAALIAAMTWLMALGSFTLVETVMLLAFVVTLPWLSIGFWNAVIGFAVAVLHRDPAAAVNPYVARPSGGTALTSRTAIVVTIRNEDPAGVLQRLEAMYWDVVRSGDGRHFAFFVLSDTSRPDIADAEEALIAEWRKRASPTVPVHYRRRSDNIGYKAGNIENFCAAHHAEYDFFLPFDADSRMSARAILRLVRIMQAAPEIGILQGLVVGAPSVTFFTRAFQFGMRHGMRAFTLGAAWWQGDCGPYWGHNALIRMDAFHAHCRLPVLSGNGPLSGHLMSHDQVEAVLMRRAGYEVRVLAEEDESFEQNPPSLTDFIKRETRWCQGNMQYLRLLKLPGLLPTSRVQLLLAVAMYLAAPAWIVFITAGASTAIFTDQFGSVPLELGLSLFVAIMAFNLMPKLMGVAQSLVQARVAAAYGGRWRLAAGAVTEFLFTILIAPSVAFAVTVCCIGLICGQRIRWEAQQRSRESLSLREATLSLWPQTLYGLTLALVLGFHAPWALLFGIAIVAPLLFAIPIATLTTLPRLGAWTRSVGLLDIPEDRMRADTSRSEATAVAA